MPTRTTLSLVLTAFVINNVINNMLTSATMISAALSSFEEIICATCSSDSDCGGNYFCDSKYKVCSINECSNNDDCNSGEYCWSQRCCDDGSVGNVTSTICVTDVCYNGTSDYVPSPTNASAVMTTIATVNSTYYDDYICATNGITYLSQLDLLCHDTCVSHHGKCTNSNNSTSSGHHQSTTQEIINKITQYFHDYLYYSIGVIVLAFICLVCCCYGCCRVCCRRRNGGNVYARHGSERVSYPV